MAGLPRGIYERLATQALEVALDARDDGLKPLLEELRPAEAGERLALHLARLVERAVESLDEGKRVERAVALTRELIDALNRLAPDLDADDERPADRARVLTAVARRLPDGQPETLRRPLIPLLDTALLTNAPGEPTVMSQLAAEIPSADRIDLVMAFIRFSGLRPLLDALTAHCHDGRHLRVLTTTYTGTTEARALEALANAGATVRISYDVSGTRLHAKAWHFHRDSGFSTAYIGSSNLTHSAQVTGLEWNLRASGARNPTVLEKMAAVFEAYWNSGDFEPWDAATFHARTERSATGPTLMLSPVEVRLEPFQERLLEQLTLARSQGHHRNLLVSATGTGKTVMAAVDYARLTRTLPGARLLFVAHRREILEQALSTFRHALRDAAFGELWFDGQKPERFEHVFASIQSLSREKLAWLAAEHFDVVIVDEFHHAAASSYDALLQRLKPAELLGLTATPERSDGVDVLGWFDGRIAAELRLWDAIDQRRLVPFSWFGISDSLDLRELPWRRGRGYDVDGLSRLITANDLWGNSVIVAIQKYVGVPERMRALGFCVSVEHARYMARLFNQAGLAAAAVWAESNPSDRRGALEALANGELRAVFSVDLFNEGVDLPDVDTLLMLRPTDSPTLFLQQLGRGLRKHEGKALCTVLDFVGQHRREFRFDRKLRALLGGTRKALAENVEADFPFLPAGCSMRLDPVARARVLENIKAAIPRQWAEKARELRAHVDEGRPARLTAFLDESGYELADIYAGDRSWSDLCEAARLHVASAGPNEATLRRGCGRLLHVDDPERLEAWRRFLKEPALAIGSLSERERRLLRMLVAQVCESAPASTASLEAGWALLRAHPQVVAELDQLFEALTGSIDHVQTRLEAHPDVPLRLHARYTRIEILAAFGVGAGARAPRWQEGVRWLKDVNLDLLAFTLDKTAGQFSPTTRYRDYAVSRDLIHWQSQSTTGADSDTGLRYQRHRGAGGRAMLFARERADERASWFLGPASYQSHVGERPMSITWHLEMPLPGDLFVSFAAAVA